MRYIINDNTDPYWNMAFDEWCLENLPVDEPVFYLWRNSPSVIIGLNQNAYGEVNLPYLESRGIKLVRRVTGGGAVYHDLQNLNYTIIGRDVTPEPFVTALRTLGVEAETTGRNDILVGGRKVSGYARRVWKNRTMIHGTLMYDVDMDTLAKALDVPGSKLNAKGVASVRSRVANLADFAKQYRSVLDVRDALEAVMAGDGALPFSRDTGKYRIKLSQEQLDEVTELRDSKFALWEWNWGRSGEAEFRRRCHLGCGTVEAQIAMDRGRIRAISFCGDFIGDRPVEELEARLMGCVCTREALEPLLRDCGKYFDGTHPEELLNLIA